MAKKRPPPNVLVPPERTCKWCGQVVKRHCKNAGCRWYPCRACSVVTVITLIETKEGFAWEVSWRKVSKKFWYE